MAESIAAAAEAAPLPISADIERAKDFTREPFVLEGEPPEEALAPGSARRRALDAALAELDAGADHPSVEWRREFSLLLGLERLLAQDEPHLADGTELTAHQVDALSGTLIALTAEVQRAHSNGNGNGAVTAPVSPAELASSAIPGEEEIDEEVEPDEEPVDWADEEPDLDEDAQLPEQPEDPNAARRFWFEHATGSGKTVAAMGFVEASRTGGILILTHRRNLVDQFHGELRERGYAKRISPALLGDKDRADGPVTVETYQWFVRNAGKISDAYTIVICDEAHTALGEKTSAAIRRWHGPIFIGMTATGALIARHVTDLFPTQTSRFDLAQAARRGVIAPLRCIRIPPGPGVRTIAKVPLRRGEVDTEFDQEMLAELLDQHPFNIAVADLYKSRFNGVPGVVYAAGVRHAYNVAEAMRADGLKAQAVSGETPKRELTRILAAYERGEIDVLVNAQLLAEGWNSPRATVCMHLAPTASKRIYQQRVGRVTRRQPGKEAGLVVDFVHPATKHDDPVVTLHSLLDRDVYRGGAIVVGPVRRGRGRRVRVERRVLPVTPEPERRAEVFERELWRIAVEHLDYGEQHVWAALGRRARRPERLAPGQGHAPLRPSGRAQAPLPAHRDPAQPQHAAATAGAVGDRVAAGCRGLRRRRADRGDVVARREARGGQGAPPGAGREADRSPGPGQRVDLAPRRVHPRDPRGVRRSALARDQATARPARQLLRPGARPQRTAPRPCRAQAGPPPVGRPARGRAGPHARGPAGARRRAHADGAQAERAGARAAEELPQARRTPARTPARGGRRRQERRRRKPSQKAAAAKRNGPEAPDEKVLDEALAAEAMEAAKAGNDDAPLEDDAHETLEHQVADTLEEVLEESLEDTDQNDSDSPAAARGSDPLSGGDSRGLTP